MRRATSVSTASTTRSAFCATLRERLRCKEIWVVGADRYRNPDDDLPAGLRRASATTITHELGAAARRRGVHHRPPGEMTRAALDDARSRAASEPDGQDPSAERHRIVVSPLVALPEPLQPVGVSKTKLGRPLADDQPARHPQGDRPARRLSRVHFASLASHEALDPETLQPAFAAVPVWPGHQRWPQARRAMATHGENCADLRYVLRRFIHKEPLRSAIADVVNATFRARRPDIWGEGPPPAPPTARSSAPGTRTC